MQEDAAGGADPEQSSSAFDMGELAMPLEAERPLIAVRASAVDVDFAYGKQHMAAGFAVTRFEIEDMLVGRRCAAHCFLARSFEALPPPLTPPVRFGSTHGCRSDGLTQTQLRLLTALSFAKG